MSPTLKAKSLSVLVLLIISIVGTSLAYSQSISNYCYTESNVAEKWLVRDWVVEHPFSSGLLFSFISVNSSYFGSGGREAEERDPYAVGFEAYCLNVKHSSKIHKAGKSMGYLIILMVVFFGFATLTRKLTVAAKWN